LCAHARCVQPASGHSHHVDSCEIECSPLPRFRSRPATACALLSWSNCSKNDFSSSSARLASETTLLSGTGASFLLASSGEVRRCFFVTKRMRLFPAPHPQLSVIPLLNMDRVLYTFDRSFCSRTNTCERGSARSSNSVEMRAAFGRHGWRPLLNLSVSAGAYGPIG